MQKSFYAAIVLLAAGAFIIRAEDPKPHLELDTLDKRAGYSMGFQLGSDLKRAGASVDVEALAQGIRDGLAGTAPIISEATMQSSRMEWQRDIQQKMVKAEAEKAKKMRAEGVAFLESNRNAEGVKVTASGLQYKCVKEGNGERPTAADIVKVHYEGTLIDGTVFDSSRARGREAEFPLGNVIKGWTEGLQLMDKGSTYMLYIPPDLGYGDQQSGKIPPGSVLIFKIELIDFKKHAGPPPGGMPGQR
jgi:FKBP-type peptidyl-prolyl cis-trans isomerase